MRKSFLALALVLTLNAPAQAKACGLWCKVGFGVGGVVVGFLAKTFVFNQPEPRTQIVIERESSDYPTLVSRGERSQVIQSVQPTAAQIAEAEAKVRFEEQKRLALAARLTAELAAKAKIDEARVISQINAMIEKSGQGYALNSVSIRKYAQTQIAIRNSVAREAVSAPASHAICVAYCGAFHGEEAQLELNPAISLAADARTALDGLNSLCQPYEYQLSGVSQNLDGTLSMIPVTAANCDSVKNIRADMVANARP